MKNAFKEFTVPRSLCGMALCLAMGVILKCFVSIYITPELELSLVFLPFSLAGMLYGPAAGFFVGGLTDLLGFFIKPTGPYFPGFTLTAALTGLVFGLLLYRLKSELWRVAVAKTVINVFLNLALNTLWLTVLMNKGFWAMLPSRVIKNLALLVPEILLTWGIINPIAQIMKKSS